MYYLTVSIPKTSADDFTRAILSENFKADAPELTKILPDAYCPDENLDFILFHFESDEYADVEFVDNLVSEFCYPIDLPLFEKGRW